MNTSTYLFFTAGNAICIQQIVFWLLKSPLGPKWLSLWTSFWGMNSMYPVLNHFSMAFFFLVPMIPLLALFNVLFVYFCRRRAVSVEAPEIAAAP